MSTTLRKQLQATLEGAYTLERELGGGGMAHVFVAEEHALGRRVVVKVLAPELTEGLSAERFAREVRLAARLQHPNIVPVLAAGERDGLAYYTMPYVEGESLRARLAREGRLPVEAAISVLRDVARALEYAHARGVVHRDIKPDNVLLAGSAAAVADFGIAKALDVARTAGTSEASRDGTPRVDAAESLTRVGTSLGTPAYMAPEQAAGDPDVDARADVYAWGIVAYELLAGTSPFAGRAAHQLIAAQIGELPPPLVERAPDVPAAFAALVMRCLEKNPARRPQSAGELLAALESARTLTGVPADIRAVASPTTHRRRKRRAALGIAVVLIGIAAATFAYRARRALAPERPVIAVLPFENLGPATDAYFADGLTEEVRGRLAGIAGLRVIGGTSARQYKGTAKRPREIARELGATHLLTGTVQWDRTPNGAGRVRVNAELVRGNDEASVWAEPMDRPLDDIFTIQTQLAERVAAALDVALLARERRAVAVRPTANLAAYDAYLRGLAASSVVGMSRSGGIHSAIDEFERAVALDSGFAPAYARLARAYSVAFLYEGRDSATLARARESVKRAWALDSTRAETRLGQAAYLMAAGDPAGAERTLLAATDAAPGDPEAFLLLTEAAQQLGRPDRGISSAERAARLDPQSLSAFGRLSELYDRTFRYEDAIRAREHEIALAPDNSLSYASQACSYLLWRADTAAARRMLERGGPALEAGWLVWLPSFQESAQVLSEKVLPLETLRARDTVTLDGYVKATKGAIGPDVFYFMKLRHFGVTGRTAQARVHAESIVVRLGPALQDRGDIWLVYRSMRASLAEAYAYLGRPADAAREADRTVTEARRSSNAADLPPALAGAAYVDVLIGRRDSAVARLEEALRLPAGVYVSRALLRADPSWAPLRGHPGFERLIAGGS